MHFLLVYCLSVSRLTQKVTDRFGIHFQEVLEMGQGSIDLKLGVMLAPDRHFGSIILLQSFNILMIST